MMRRRVWKPSSTITYARSSSSTEIAAGVPDIRVSCSGLSCQSYQSTPSLVATIGPWWPAAAHTPRSPLRNSRQRLEAVEHGVLDAGVVANAEPGPFLEEEAANGDIVEAAIVEDPAHPDANTASPH
jgi:hypothetical protein